MLEVKAKDGSANQRPKTKFCPRGQLVLEDLTSLVVFHICKIWRIRKFADSMRHQKAKWLLALASRGVPQLPGQP